MPTLVMLEGENDWVASIVVPAKGADDYAIEAVGKEIDLSGLTKMSIKSDQEPAILNLIQAVRRERPETIECMTPEESPVGESKSNGAIENAIRNVQGQVRTLKLMLEERYKVRIGENHMVLPWLVKYAGVLINICRVGQDGKTPYERRRGRKWKKALPVFGECIWWLRPESAGAQKLETRWENGIYLGVRTESTK